MQEPVIFQVIYRNEIPINYASKDHRFCGTVLSHFNGCHIRTQGFNSEEDVKKYVETRGREGAPIIPYAKPNSHPPITVEDTLAQRLPPRKIHPVYKPGASIPHLFFDERSQEYGYLLRWVDRSSDLEFMTTQIPGHIPREGIMHYLNDQGHGHRVRNADGKWEIQISKDF